jgi:hypothetical protein
MNHADSSTQYRDHAMAGDTTDQPDAAFPANSQQLDQPTAMEDYHQPDGGTQ